MAALLSLEHSRISVTKTADKALNDAVLRRFVNRNDALINQELSAYQCTGTMSEGKAGADC